MKAELEKWVSESAPMKNPFCNWGSDLQVRHKPCLFVTASAAEELVLRLLHRLMKAPHISRMACFGVRQPGCRFAVVGVVRLPRRAARAAMLRLTRRCSRPRQRAGLRLGGATSAPPETARKSQPSFRAKQADSSLPGSLPRTGRPAQRGISLSFGVCVVTPVFGGRSFSSDINALFAVRLQPLRK
jgi:hypothetical protein